MKELIPRCEQLSSAIAANKWVTDDVREKAFFFTLEVENMKKNYADATEHLRTAEEEASKGKEYRRHLRIIRSTVAFNHWTDRLQRELHELQKEPILDEYSPQMVQIHEMIEKARSDPEYLRVLPLLEERVATQTEGFRRLLTGLLPHHIPRLNETWNLGKNIVHIRLGYSIMCSEHRVKERVHQLTRKDMDDPTREEILPDRLADSKNTGSLLQKLLDMVRDALNQILLHDTRILLTSRTCIHVIINHEAGYNGQASPQSTPDHYIVNLNLDTVLKHFLYTSSPSENLPHTAIFNGEYTYRALSLTDMISHELQHCADQWGANVHAVAALAKQLIADAPPEDAFLTKATLNIAYVYIQARLESLAQFREHMNRTSEGFTNILPLMLSGTAAVIAEVNAALQRVNENSDEDRIPDGYLMGHIISSTILLADCQRNRVEATIMKKPDFDALVKRYPSTAPLAMNRHPLEPPQGTIAAELIAAMRTGNAPALQAALAHEGMQHYGINDVAHLLSQDTPLVLFLPPYAQLSSTLQHIALTDELSFTAEYKKACDMLGIKSRIKTLKEFEPAAVKTSELYAKALKKRGILP
jgi:hypothetical protein